MKKASGDIPWTPFSYPKTAKRLLSFFVFFVSDDGLFGKLHLRRSAAPRALRRTFSTPPVYKACIPSTSESSTPSRRPLTPVFRYAPKNGNRRGLCTYSVFRRHVLRPSVADLLRHTDSALPKSYKSCAYYGPSVANVLRPTDVLPPVRPPLSPRHPSKITPA